MIERIKVQHFQSLHDIDIKLDRFTVIVGPSSSGKSAFTRALSVLTSNQRGDSFVSHGENQTTIIAKTDRGTVALQRGKKNEYVLIPLDGEKKTYTKLNGTTPDEVSEFLGIPANEPLNYANQFDMPYLLKASAAEVARTLGELTNVSVIFEAAREANKRRLASSSLLKTRSSDYASLTANLDQYKGLAEKTLAITDAEEHLAEAKRLEQQIARLSSLITQVQDIPEVRPERTLPSLEEPKKIFEKVQRLTSLLAEAEQLKASARIHHGNATDASENVRAKREEYLAKLKSAGTCPTCGQETSHIHE